MNNFLEDLKEYFENTPREKVLEDWEKASEYDESGVLVEDFLLKLENKKIMNKKDMKLVELAREAVINSPKTICEKIAGIVMEEASEGGTYISYYIDDYPETDYIVEYFKKEGFDVRITGLDDDFIEISW